LKYFRVEFWANLPKALFFGLIIKKMILRYRFCLKLCKKTGVKILVKWKKLDIPNYDDENIVIYKAKYRSGHYVDSDYYGEDRHFTTQPNAMTAEEISAHPSKYFCCLGFFSFTPLIDMKPKSGTVYIHSASEPYNEEQEISQDRVDAWLEHFSMNKFKIKLGRSQTRLFIYYEKWQYYNDC